MWATFRQRRARRRLTRMRALERRADRHEERLDAQGRTLTALIGRLDLTQRSQEETATLAGQLQQIQADLDARLSLIEQLLDDALAAGAGAWLGAAGAAGGRFDPFATTSGPGGAGARGAGLCEQVKT